MGDILRYIAIVPATIIKFVLGIVTSIILFPMATIALVFKVDWFESFDEIWAWVVDF